MSHERIADAVALSPEALAKTGVALGVSLFGVTLADISTIVTIIAGLAAAFASITAGIYYIRKARER